MNKIWNLIKIRWSEDNILGISFAEKNRMEDNIEIIESNFPNSDRRRIRTSKEEVLKEDENSYVYTYTYTYTYRYTYRY